ncbi:MULTISPECIES: type IV secretory system conjugative DNA transfer family protein [unclassified Streptomyces]|uniref:type IV secretory system conjugative DNA transfer family protein n=1 Tax=unclassified Streptomyces TaxID=2593676 RepID=UPI002E29C449|nr:type IV secretory system conjugative DNA transfer family protein [Streptomyces sp. NBC_00223]
MADRKKQSSQGLPDGLILGIIAFLLGVTLLVWTATGIAALLSHSSWPGQVHFTRTPQAMRALVRDPHDIAAAWPGAEVDELPGPGLFWGILIGQFMVLFVLAVWVMNIVARLRTRDTRRTVRRAAPAPPEPEPVPYEPAAPPVPAPRRRDPYQPYAKSGGDTLDAWFRTVPGAAPFGHDDAPTSQLPPVAAESEPGGPAATFPTAPPDEPPPAFGRLDAHLAALADGEVNRTYALFASPRGDKGKRVVQPAVLAAAGPVVVTTADPDTYHQTVGNRAKLGPVHVYDPAHLLDIPGRLRWAPHGGCERPEAARTRAAALLAPLRTARADEAIVHDTAVTLLRCWLHAAAVDGRPFRQVQRWASGGTAAGEAVRILRTDTGAVSGWSGELESVLHAHTERRDAAQALIRRTLEPLNSVHIRDACNPGRTGGLDLESFTAERGTLYVVGERVEDPRTRLSAMPLLTALLSSVVEHGRRVAAGSSAGRLDPPMTFVLDDVAAVAPVPELAALLDSGREAGLPTLAVFRSPEQVLARWRVGLWGSADVRLILGDGEVGTSVPDAVRLG